VIRRVVRIAIIGGAVAWAADRLLRRRAAGAPPPAIQLRTVIDAPIERVWAVVSDIEGQPRWMHDMKSVRMTTPRPTRVGSRGEATVRMFGVGVTDPVTVTAFEPPTSFAVSHEGAFSGGGTFRLAPMGDGAATIVEWDEELAAPVLAHAAAVVTTPIFRHVFQGDLDRLRALIETGAI
jgi:uncharacterized protein YndB with AHSA1/START domain